MNPQPGRPAVAPWVQAVLLLLASCQAQEHVAAPLAVTVQGAPAARVPAGLRAIPMAAGTGAAYATSTGPDGSLYVAGTIEPSPEGNGARQIFLVRLDANGQKLWRRILEGGLVARGAASIFHREVPGSEHSRRYPRAAKSTCDARGVAQRSRVVSLTVPVGSNLR
jgi:hypothetical protein